jgi:hypothetical protein
MPQHRDKKPEVWLSMPELAVSQGNWSHRDCAWFEPKLFLTRVIVPDFIPEQHEEGPETRFQSVRRDAKCLQSYPPMFVPPSLIKQSHWSWRRRSVGTSEKVRRPYQTRQVSTKETYPPHEGSIHFYNDRLSGSARL